MFRILLFVLFLFSFKLSFAEDLPEGALLSKGKSSAIAPGTLSAVENKELDVLRRRIKSDVLELNEMIAHDHVRRANLAIAISALEERTEKIRSIIEACQTLEGYVEELVPLADEPVGSILSVARKAAYDIYESTVRRRADSMVMRGKSMTMCGQIIEKGKIDLGSKVSGKMNLYFPRPKAGARFYSIETADERESTRQTIAGDLQKITEPQTSLLIQQRFLDLVSVYFGKDNRILGDRLLECEYVTELMRLGEGKVLRDYYECARTLYATKHAVNFFRVLEGYYRLVVQITTMFRQQVDDFTHKSNIKIAMEALFKGGEFFQRFFTSQKSVHVKHIGKKGSLKVRFDKPVFHEFLSLATVTDESLLGVIDTAMTNVGKAEVAKNRYRESGSMLTDMMIEYLES